jgi:hypothetical protein
VSKRTIEIPESLQPSIRALAEQEGYSIDQPLSIAATEKMAALRTLDYLRKDAASGRREEFDRFLAVVPTCTPTETDRLPE